MNNYICVFKKAIKSWDEVTAVVTKISIGLSYYKAILNSISFGPYNFDVLYLHVTDKETGSYVLNNAPKINFKERTEIWFLGA